MELEEYYIVEYGRDISNLEALVTLFEDELVLKDHKHGALILKLVKVSSNCCGMLFNI
jgi:hypothetical protein